MILNLKRMNKQTKKIHFKMDTITSIMRLIRPTCYFTKVDLKEAYYSIQIHQNDTKLLKFFHRGKLIETSYVTLGQLRNVKNSRKTTRTERNDK